MASSPRIPVNVIGGFLGVGKTTAINHLLRQKPAAERWAVLVNEFGEIGIDGALLSEERRDGIEIKELAGGCICCSAGVMFQVSLAVLLQSYRPDRLLIEPTGLATLSGVLDTLREPGFVDAVELRTFVILVDPAHWSDPRYREHPVWQDQIDGADALLASRCDLSEAPDVEAFEAWAAELFPPKRHLGRLQRGALDPALLDLVSDRTTAIATPEPVRPAHAHTHESAPHAHAVHRSEHGVTMGWVFPPDALFLAQRFSAWLERLAARDDILRLKAVVRSERGWHAHNVTPGSRERRPCAYRRDSRIELIFTPSSDVDPDALKRELRGCIAGQRVKTSG